MSRVVHFKTENIDLSDTDGLYACMNCGYVGYDSEQVGKKDEEIELCPVCGSSSEYEFGFYDDLPDEDE